MRNVGRFIYNPDTKEVFGRTGISWLKILSFYLVFYLVLAGFFATCMVCFIRTLDGNAPMMQKMYSMLKDNPGMNFEPYFTGNGSTLIAFDPYNSTTYTPYVTEINQTYAAYLNQSIPPGLYKACTAGDGADAAQACQFDMSSLGHNCTPDNEFGYPDGKPCVMLKINRVFLWDPNGVTLGTTSCDRTKDATNSQCTKTLQFVAISENIRTGMDPAYVAVSCQGENDGDADNIRKVTFYPAMGFPAYYFPYHKQPNYTSPMVMAQFDVIEGRVSLILCQVWTQDIIQDRIDLQASIHFELMVSRMSANETRPIA